MRFHVNVSDTAAQIVSMQYQSLQSSLAMVATKQAMKQEQAIVNLLAEATASLPAGNGERGKVIDLLV